MKIERNATGNGMVLTNGKGESLNVSFMEFWEICKHGTRMDTRDEVANYLRDCDYIGEVAVERIKAFPELVDKITEQVIKDRIDDESGDQIYDAANKCISEHIAEIESKIKWFKLSEYKCISVRYAPDEHDGDQFQMYLEEVGEDGYMGSRCELVSDDAYATADLSFKSLCETLSEICDDAEIYDEEATGSNSDTAVRTAHEIFDAFGMIPARAVVEFKEFIPGSTTVRYSDMGGMGSSHETSVDPIDVDIKISVRKDDESKAKDLLDKAWDNAVLDLFEGSPLDKANGGEYSWDELDDMPVQEYMLRYLDAHGVAYENLSPGTKDMPGRSTLEDKIKSAEARTVTDVQEKGAEPTR